MPTRKASPSRAAPLERIISGGQTGVDRAALEVALRHGLPHGGWCPKGRWAEDGAIPARYLLTETPSPEPEQRTEWNVRDSDATVIFSIAPVLTGGSAYTLRMTRRWGRPCLHLARMTFPVTEAAQHLIRFLQDHQVRVLNVAGPRVSTEPEAAQYATAVMEEMLTRLRRPGTDPAPATRVPPSDAGRLEPDQSRGTCLPKAAQADWNPSVGPSAPA